MVRNESPFKTYQEFVAAARGKPGTLNLAGSGTNLANHAAHERLNQAAGIKTTYVAFKGTGDLLSSLLGGHVDGAMSYSSLAVAQKGKTRLLAVATPQRLPYFPDVPTFRELGVDWVDGGYRGAGVPKSTSEDLRKRISDMFFEINRDADFRRGKRCVRIQTDRSRRRQSDRPHQSLFHAHERPLRVFDLRASRACEHGRTLYRAWL